MSGNGEAAGGMVAASADHEVHLEEAIAAARVRGGGRGFAQFKLVSSCTRELKQMKKETNEDNEPPSVVLDP